MFEEICGNLQNLAAWIMIIGVLCAIIVTFYVYFSGKYDTKDKK